MATVSNPAVPVKLQRVPKRGVPSLDEDLLDVLRCCLKKDPVERITTEVSTQPGSADRLAYALILLHDFTMEAAITWSEARKASYVRHAVREYTIHKALHHRNIVSLTDQPHSALCPLDMLIVFVAAAVFLSVASAVCFCRACSPTPSCSVACNL
jgi:hypothetical protein